MPKNPSISISFSQNKFAQEVNKMAAELKTVRKEFEISNLAIEATGDKTALAANKLKGFGEEAKLIRNAAMAMQQGLDEAANTQSKLAMRVEAAKQAYESAAKSQTSSKEQVEKLKQEYEDLAQRLSKADKSVQNWQNKLMDSQLAENKLKVAISQTNKEIDDQNKKQAENIKNTRNVTTATGQLFNIYTLLKGLAIGYAGKTLFEALIGGNAQFEQYMASFEVLLGGAEQAQKRMDELTVFAAKTPFELPQVVEAEKRLLAYGVAAKDTAKVMPMLGDISMGNAEKLNMISLAYGQVITNQRLYGTELRQFAENGVPLLAELAKMYGVTEAEMRSMVEEGKIGSDAVTSALGRMTSEGGKFYGMMEKQSQTMGGLWSTLKDNVNMFARDVGEESFGYLKGALSDFMSQLNQLSESGELDDIAANLGRGIGQFIEFIINAIKTLWDMKEVLLATGEAFIAFKISMGISGVIMSVISAIQTYTTAVNAGKTATAALTVVMNRNPWILLASAVAAVIVGIIGYNMATGDAKSKTEELTEDVKNLREEYEQSSESIDRKTNSELAEVEVAKKLAGELDTLREKTNKTVEEKNRMLYIVDELNKRIPNLNLAINAETGEINKQTSAIYANIGALRAQAIAQGYRDKATAAGTAYVNQQDLLEETQGQLDSETGKLNTLKEKYGKAYDEVQQLRIKAKKEGMSLDTLGRGIFAINKSYGITDPQYENQINQQIKKVSELTSLIEDQTSQLNEYSNEIDKYSNKAMEYAPKDTNLDTPPPSPPPPPPPPLLDKSDYKDKINTQAKILEDAYDKEFDIIKKKGQLLSESIDRGKKTGIYDVNDELKQYDKLLELNKDYLQKIIDDTKLAQDKKTDILEQEIGNIQDIEDKILDIRKEYIEKAVNEYIDSKRKQYDIEEELENKRLNAALEAIDKEYEAQDMADRKQERNSQLKELRQQEKMYLNAATQEGQNRLKDIQNKIKGLINEGEKEQLELEKEQRKEDIQKAIEANKDKYDTMRDDLEKSQQEMLSVTGAYAAESKNIMTTAAGEVSDSLALIYKQFQDNNDNMMQEGLSKLRAFIEEYKKQLSSAMLNSGLDLPATLGNAGGTSKQTNIILNDYGAKNINSKDEAIDYAEELMNAAQNALRSIGG